jgi:hypothetical protein
MEPTYVEEFTANLALELKNWHLIEMLSIELFPPILPPLQTDEFRKIQWFTAFVN